MHKAKRSHKIMKANYNYCLNHPLGSVPCIPSHPIFRRGSAEPLTSLLRVGLRTNLIHNSTTVRVLEYICGA
jgi:hypothetical protein